MLARSKSGAGKIRRNRDGRRRDVAGRTGTSNAPETTVTVTTQSIASLRRRREAGMPQDQAVYTCHCGFVFEAQVSTSVGCPHCGGTQAW